METIRSETDSQEPVNGPEGDESTVHLHILRTVLMLSSHIRVCLSPDWYLPLKFSSHNFVHLISPVSSSLIWSRYKYLVKYEAPQFVILCILLLLVSLYLFLVPRHSSEQYVLQHLSIFVLPQGERPSFTPIWNNRHIWIHYVIIPSVCY
jgi:hypothetical protein